MMITVAAMEERLLAQVYRLPWGMFLPGAPVAVPRAPSAPKTLAILLMEKGIRLPPVDTGIDLTTTDCGVLHFNRRWYAVLPEANKGYGLFTVNRLRFGADLGKYDGLHTLTWEASDYIMELKACYVIGDPAIATSYFNSIPVGWGGDAVFAYINEPSDGELPNVAFCETENGEDCHVVVAVKCIAAWKPLLVCYNSDQQYPNLHFHNCEQCD